MLRPRAAQLRASDAQHAAAASSSPSQSSALVASSCCVVKPAGQATHAPNGDAALPPAPQVPWSQGRGRLRATSIVQPGLMTHAAALVAPSSSVVKPDAQVLHSLRCCPADQDPSGQGSDTPACVLPQPGWFKHASMLVYPDAAGVPVSWSAVCMLAGHAMHLAREIAWSGVARPNVPCTHGTALRTPVAVVMTPCPAGTKQSSMATAPVPLVRMPSPHCAARADRQPGQHSRRQRQGPRARVCSGSQLPPHSLSGRGSC